MAASVAVAAKIQWVKLRGVDAVGAVGTDAVLVVGGSWLLTMEVAPPHRQAILAAEGGVQVAAGHPRLPCLAYAEKSMDPRVLVLMHPGFKLLRTLPGAKDGKYHSLEFSELEQLVALVRRVTGTDIVIWNWRTAEQVGVIQATIQDPSHLIRASPTSPVRIAEWDAHRMVLWQTHPCFRKPFHSSLAVAWPVSLQPPVACSWTSDGELYLADSKGSMYSVNLETGILQEEATFPKNKAAPADGNDGPPCLVVLGASIALHAMGHVALVKRRNEAWVVSWVCPAPGLVDLVSVITAAGKDLLLGWTNENKLVAIRGEKSSVMTTLLSFGVGFDTACVIQPKAKLFVAYRKLDSLLTLWDTKTGIQVNADLGSAKDLLSLAAAPNHPFLVLGYADGFVDVLTVDPIRRQHFRPTRQPLDGVRFPPNGTLFCVSARAAGEFFLVEQDMQGSWKVSAALGTGQKAIDFCLESTSSMRLLVLESEGSRLRSYLLHRTTMAFVMEKEVTLETMYQHIATTSSFGGLLVVPSLSKRIQLLDQDLKVTREWYTGHQLSHYRVRPCGQLAITYGSDGLVVFHRATDTAGDNDSKLCDATLMTHHRVDGGTAFVDADSGASFLLVGGHSGCLLCYSTGFPSEPVKEDEVGLFVSGGPSVLDEAVTDGTEETWLEHRERDRVALVQEKHEHDKTALLNRLNKLKQEVKKLMDTNESCPEDEKLDIAEFELDVVGREVIEEEARTIRHKAHEMECAQIRVQDALADRIIASTWAKVQTPSRELRPILPSAAATAVHSYALLPKQGATDTKPGLERIKIVRDFQAVDFFQPWIPRRDSELQGHLKGSTLAPPASRRGSLAADLLLPAAIQQPQLPCSSTSAHLFLPGRSLPHSQLQVGTQHQAQDIIAMTESVIRSLMEWFNAELSAVATEKERELRGLGERRARLRYVAKELHDLSAPCELRAEDLADPTWAPAEIPETILTVRDQELETPPYFSPEELEEERRVVEEAETKRQLLLADDFRERALQAMMDGVLQKMWQDEIKKEIHKPDFMEEKGLDDWTEEEAREAKKYDEAVEKLHIERDRYKKLLATEFKKLAALTQESGARFDDKVKKLHELKLRVESAVGQEQLNMLRMRRDVLSNVQMAHKAQLIKSAIAEEERKLEVLHEEAGKLQELLGEGRMVQETLLTRDKNLDRNFKKDFPEYSPIICEQLHKLSKKRPKLPGRASNSPALLSELGRRALQGDQGRPRLPLPPDCQEYLKAVDALDGPGNTPAVVSEASWDTLCRLRRTKIDSELKIRALTLDLVETEQATAAWQKQMKASKEAIYKHQTELDALQSEHRMAELDCSVQLVVQQRVVEVPTAGRMGDFANATLLSRSVVDQVNQAIRRVGQQKVRAMQRACEFRKGIVYKEWEHQKLRMRVDDLRAQLDTLEHVHVTKELQEILTARARGVYEEKGFYHLENEMRAVNLRFEKSQLKLLQEIEEYENKMAALDHSNDDLDERIVALNQTIGHRVVLRDASGEEQEARDAKRRMHNIIQRGRLVTRAQELQAELTTLLTERDMLSLKAHPTIILKD